MSGYALNDWIMRGDVEKKLSEVDPNGRAANEPGSKLDAGKPAMFRGLIDYFPRALDAVASVSTFGASKYVWKGWETVPDGVARYSDAMVRHLTKESKGEVLDPDSGLHHAAHTAWGALARLELMLRDEESMENWAKSDEALEIVDRINNSHYLQPNARTE